MTFNLGPVQYNNLLKLLKKFNKHDDYELESRIIKSEKNIINHNSIKKILNYLIFSKENNGLGLKYKTEKLLDIQLYNNNRYTIIGDKNIKKYWLTNSLESIKYELINKKRLENVDIPNNDIRFSLSEEKNIKSKITKISNIKAYRFKNRYTIYSEDDLFKFDITISKNVNDATDVLKETNLDNVKIEYEFEIELLRNSKTKKMKDKDLINVFINYNYFILSILQDNKIIIDNDKNYSIIKDYKKLVDIKKFKIINARPVTLHLKDIQKTDKFHNILNNYAVTLKADGVNKFLYIDSNGNFYLLNKNQEILN